MQVMQAARSTTVYIVDDSAFIRQRLIAMLSTMHNVAVVGEAATEPAAIEGIVASRPDIVLLDLNLGVGNGMNVLNAVRRMLPDVSIVVLTNLAEPQYRRACMKAGARHFLDKSTQLDCVQKIISDFKANTPRSQS